jgi:Flp pilus assembly protein TadG
MKTFRPLILLLALAFASLPVLAADSTSAATIDQALKIAQDYLQKSGTDRTVIGVTLERSTLGTTYWWAKWSSAFGEGAHKETGLRIDMDGSITRFVAAPSGGYDRPAGQRPQGARTMR